jgi:hypothetical protein
MVQTTEQIWWLCGPVLAIIFAAELPSISILYFLSTGVQFLEDFHVNKNIVTC